MQPKKRKLLIDILIFLTLCSVFAFSNITLLVVSLQSILVGVTLLNILHTKKIKFSIHFYWMTCFILWGLFVSLFAYDPVLSTVTLANMFLKFLFYTSLYIYVDSEKKMNFVTKSIAIAGLVLVLRVIIFTPINAWGTERLGEAIDLNANALGVVMAYASICSLYLAKKLNQKYFYLMLIPFIFIGLLTGSRKAFFMIAGGISLLIFLSINKKRQYFIYTIIILIFIGALYAAIMNVPILYNVLGSRIESMGLSATNDVDASSRTRSIMISEALSIFHKSPFLGIGLENFRLISSFKTYSHNNYMEILSSTGIVGLFIYYSLPVTILISSFIKWVRKEKEYNIIIVLLIIVLVMDYGLVSYKQLVTQTIIVISVSYYMILTTMNIKKQK